MAGKNKDLQFSSEVIHVGGEPDKETGAAFKSVK